jgi:hypothetical protein
MVLRAVRCGAPGEHVRPIKKAILSDGLGDRVKKNQAFDDFFPEDFFALILIFLRLIRFNRRFRFSTLLDCLPIILYFV